MGVRLRRVRCPEHGALVEGVPFVRDGARFTRDFEDLVAWLASKTDKTSTCRLTRIDWQTIGRIIERVGQELIDGDRLNDLFEISIDEVAWRKGHRYLTIVGDHQRRCVVWGCEGAGCGASESSGSATETTIVTVAGKTTTAVIANGGDPPVPVAEHAHQRGHEHEHEPDQGRVDRDRHPKSTVGAGHPAPHTSEGNNTSVHLLAKSST
jgi:hypothetical protein